MSKYNTDVEFFAKLQTYITTRLNSDMINCEIVDFYLIVTSVRTAFFSLTTTEVLVNNFASNVTLFSTTNIRLHKIFINTSL